MCKSGPAAVGTRILSNPLRGKAFPEEFIAVVDQYPPEKGFATPPHNANDGDIRGIARVLEDQYDWSHDEIRGFPGDNLLRAYEVARE